MLNIFITIAIILVIWSIWVIAPALNRKINPSKRKKSTYNKTSDYQNSSQAKSDDRDYAGENDNDSSTDSDRIFFDENNTEQQQNKIRTLNKPKHKTQNFPFRKLPKYQTRKPQ